MRSYIQRAAVVSLSISFVFVHSALARAPRREVANLRADKSSRAAEKADTFAVTTYDLGIASLTPEGNSVAGGLQWLKNNQNPSGSWGDEWEFADTADVIHTLRDVEPDCNELADGVDWLAWEVAPNLEFLARQIIALAGLNGYEAITDTLVDELLVARNEAESDNALPNWPEGGWGLDVGYETDCMTTAVALCALEDFGLAGGFAVQGVALNAGEHVTYVFNVPEDANKVRVRIDALSGGPIQVRLQEGSEPPFFGISYFPISSAPVLITYPDSGIPFTPGTNYLRVDSPDFAATFSMTVSYETQEWDTRTLAEPIAYLREAQNGDGGWGLQRGSVTDLYTTIHALLALQEYSHYETSSEIAAGMVWLRSQQLLDGSFGYDDTGSVVESALGALALMGDDPYPFEADTLSDVNYLVSVQDANDSWNSEFYDTALAMLALNTFNQAPIADAGPDQWVYDTDANLVELVILDASGSNDVDGTIESYIWTENDVDIANGVSPTVEFTIGTHTIELTVTDSGGKNATDEVIIKITPPPQTIYDANMDTDPNWTAEGLWAWGVPQGNDGWHGGVPPNGPDPTSGYTGSNVYGYNLNGGYEDNLPPTYLTTQAIDCSGFTNVELRFYRWLCVESALYNGQPCDHALVEVSNSPADPCSWVTIYQNPNDVTLIETSWSLQTYDISNIVDNQAEVCIRWCMGPTDFTWNYGGWNIDDVELTGIIMPPDPPSMPDLLTEDDSGVSNTDNITGVELARVNMYVYDPKTIDVTVYNGTQEMGDAVDQGGGYWRYQFTAGQLAKGDNFITAKGLGLSGYSESSEILTISYKPHTLMGEFTGDGIVNLPDLDFLTGYWLQNEPLADIAPVGGDHVVNFLDFAVLAGQWLETELWYPVSY